LQPIGRKNNSARWPPDKIRRIQRWIIHTLCRLLNDNDQGLGLLTQFVLDWAKKGPVARNYLEERVQMYNALKNAYLCLLNDLNEPDYHNILRELEAAHAWLKQRWKPGVGVNWQPGQRCKMRKDQAQINKGPDRARHQEFTYADALSDLVEDAIVQLEPLGRTPGSGTAGASPTPANPDQKPNVINALLQCLQSDFPMQQMETMYGTGIVRDPDALARLQAFGFERLTRVVDYLVRASESQLRQIMRYCYPARPDPQFRSALCLRKSRPARGRARPRSAGRSVASRCRFAAQDGLSTVLPGL
jgi:hypothetical protein